MNPEVKRCAVGAKCLSAHLSAEKPIRKIREPSLKGLELYGDPLATDFILPMDEKRNFIFPFIDIWFYGEMFFSIIRYYISVEFIYILHYKEDIIYSFNCNTFYMYILNPSIGALFNNNNNNIIYAF